MKYLLALCFAPVFCLAQSTGDYMLSQKTSTGVAQVVVVPALSSVWGIGSNGAFTQVPQTDFAAALHYHSWASVTSRPASLVSLGALIDPGADRLTFWDESENAFAHLTLGSGLSITDTSLNVVWGGITGSLSNQTDLQSALNAKLATATAATTYQPLTANLTSLGANDTGYYLGRANHTGTQAWSTLTGTPTTTAGYGIANLTTTGTVGYATGAGGVATQFTNRTTGVSLNKTCGSITTHTASLAVGAEAAFTVTNSTVAVDDTVVLSIRSGATATPQAWVSAVAAGSFQITISNLHATAAETGAIIINFAVVKAVAN